ncbi:MAG: putative DNA binding domain-containing protein [Eubacteriales bacterium]|nr:putative DNA binding domain-containing protein [Eubacteriales bacterium]
MNIGYETETIEFKKTTGELREGIISLSSMINKSTYGTLYFGIRNDGEVIGQEVGDKTLRDVSQTIATNIKPQLIPKISLELIEGKNVIKVESEGNDKPYSAFGKYYIRSADEDREMSPNQLKNYMRDKEDADIITTIASENQGLTFRQLKTLFATKGLSVNEESFERNLGLLTSAGKYNIMAELLADKNDISVKVVSFEGEDKSVIVRRNEYGFKCLAVAMDQVLSYMEAINDTKVSLNSHQRTEKKLFDFSSLKEAWQNACLHTKWQKKNPPAVYIFSNRIEIISTGGLISDLSREEFFKGISKPVNAKLQKIFGQLGFVEQTGHGIPLIISQYGMQAFDVTDNFVNVTIPFNTELITKNEKDKTVIFNLNHAQQKVYNFLKENPEATIEEMVKSIRFSNAYIRKIMNYLKNENLLIRVGSNKTGYWQVY